MEETVFCGKADKLLDKKGRISFSRRIRGELGEEPIITITKGKSLRIYPQKKEKEFKPCDFWRMRFDKQERLSIPDRLIKSIPGGRKIIVIGKGNFLEIQSR